MHSVVSCVAGLIALARLAAGHGYVDNGTIGGAEYQVSSGSLSVMCTIADQFKFIDVSSKDLRPDCG